MQRNSKKRSAIYDAVKMTRRHPTAQDVWLELRSKVPGLSLATVYRNLAEFAEEGRMRRLDGLDGQSRFDADLSPHSHFTCTQCGAVLDVPFDAPLELEQQAEKTLGATVISHELSFFGLCADCSKKQTR